MSDFAIKSMNSAELELAIQWAADEGWNPGIHDIQSYLETDSEGFLMGYLNGKPIGSISAVKYPNNFGFMGFYIVLPEYRGQGYGIKLWHAAIAHLAGHNIGLDGVVEQQENYKKSGFRYAHANYRYQTTGGGDTPRSPDIIPLSNLPIEIVLRYSEDFFPAKRDPFLTNWIKQDGSIGYGIMENGHLVGYSLARPCREGYKIGPLFANSASHADMLFATIRSKIPDVTPIFLDIPERNTNALQLAETYHMERVFETARMYTGPEPDISIDRTYAITSFEIG